MWRTYSEPRTGLSSRGAIVVMAPCSKWCRCLQSDSQGLHFISTCVPYTLVSFLISFPTPHLHSHLLMAALETKPNLAGFNSSSPRMSHHYSSFSVLTTYYLSPGAIMGNGGTTHSIGSNPKTKGKKA